MSYDVTLQIKVNGGAPQTGLVRPNVGDVIQLTVASRVGWPGSPPVEWQIWRRPPGFALPASWSYASDDVTMPAMIASGSADPPPFTIGPWGAYFTRILVGGVVADQRTFIKVASPSGRNEIARLETSQDGGPKEQWAAVYNANLRIEESATITAATVDAQGAMPAVAYQAFVGQPGTDPTTSVSTTGAAGTYTEVTVTNVASTIDPSITDLSYDRCHDTGHAAAGKLIPLLLIPGFNQSRTQFSAAMKRQLASYVDPTTGRAFCVIGTSSRGRGGGGSVDEGARESYDLYDILVHARAALGSLAFGSGVCCAVMGVSTGGHGTEMFFAHFPDVVLGRVIYYPNHDLGVDPADSYWAIQSSTQRSTYLTPQIGDRAQGAATALDPYLARNPIDATARLTAIPGAPHVWVLGDRTEAPNVPIPNPDRYANALRAIPASSAKTHVHITQSGDSNRILHDTDVDLNSGGTLYAHRYWVPFVLANAAEWYMPRKSPDGALRVLGYMETRALASGDTTPPAHPGWKLWLGPSTSPRSTAGAGGKRDAAELWYDDSGRRFRVTPITSQNGFCEVIRDNEDRSVATVAGTLLQIDMNVSRTITAVTDIGVEHSFRADAGVTGTTTVTNWADQVGALAFVASGGTEPSKTTDADSKNLIRFASASSQRMTMASLLVNPKADFTIFMVVNKTNSSQGWFLACSNHGTFAELALYFTSGVDGVQYLLDVVSTTGLANAIGGHTFSTSAKHFLALMRKNGVMYESIDGSAWSKSLISADTFTLTGTVSTSLGAGWATGGGAYWQFLQGDIYEVDSKQAATSEADLLSMYALMKSRWTF